MAERAILFTQCLQNDFAAPIARYAPTPNGLHVGADEARRLHGAMPAASAAQRRSLVVVMLRRGLRPDKSATAHSLSSSGAVRK